MDREITIQGPVARDGKSFRADVEAAHQPGTWIADSRADFFPARTNWRRAQLGLSLYLVARCHIHPVRADPAGFC